jgi:hypothetical protein
MNVVTWSFHSTKPLIMKSKILILCISCLFTAVLFAQPCVPDNNIPFSQGIFPSELQPAMPNVAYNQVIQFKAPLDTLTFIPDLGASLNVRIDSIRILNVLGLPPGMSYACNNSNCLIEGGKTGCLAISGTTSTSGGYPLQVITLTNARVFLTPTTTLPQSRTDTNTRYGVFVSWPSGVATIKIMNNVSVFPNPTKENLYIESTHISSNAFNCSIIDATGKLVMDKKINLTANNYALNIQHLADGLYFVMLQCDDEVFVQKITKQSGF